MPRYNVYFHTYAGTSIEVEAEDKDAAIEKAYEEGSFPTICAQCSGWGKKENLYLGDVWEDDGADEVVD